MNQWDKKDGLQKIQDIARKSKDNPFELYKIMSMVSENGSGYLILQGLFTDKIKLQVGYDVLPGGVTPDIEDGYEGGKKESADTMGAVVSDFEDFMGVMDDMLIDALESNLEDMNSDGYNEGLSKLLSDVVSSKDEDFKYELLYKFQSYVQNVDNVFEFYKRAVQRKGKEPKENSQDFVKETKRCYSLLHDMIFVPDSDVAYR